MSSSARAAQSSPKQSAPFAIAALPVAPNGSDLRDLTALLRDAVEGGASVGFMLPLRDDDIAAFWQEVFSDAKAGKRLVLAARDGNRIVGSTQLELAGRPNSRHRAELQKLLVLRSHRGRRIGRGLIEAAEAEARAHQRSLIVLDTSTTGNAVNLSAHCGYTRAGVIPRYARDPDGPLIDTAIYYKELAP